jgi:uncharacterized hydrophobic protein (TIGR00341 family)
MKKILIHVRNEDYEKMQPLLDEIYHLVIGRGDFIQIKAFVPDADLDDTVQRLREHLDLRYRENLIEVDTPDFVISSTLARAEKSVEKMPKTPIEDLLDSARDYSSLDTWSLALTSIAGLIALTGLFMNNVAIIIGAMLLSPILGPIHSFVIYAAVGRSTEAVRSIAVLAALLLSVFIVSTVVTFLIAASAQILDPQTTIALTDEILSRMESSPIYILMAILLGSASILALTRGASEYISGVAVAAALLPPTVVAGIAVVLYPVRLIDTIILVSENVIGLIAGALIATLVLGIAPRDGREVRVAKQFVFRTALLIIALILILALGSLFI